MIELRCRLAVAIRLLLALTGVQTIATAEGFAADDLILCQRPGAADIVISRHDRDFKGRSLDCISGDFVVDMTPCAPPGGYGLSAPTGTAALAEIVDRWQDYRDHFGPVTGLSVTPGRIVFQGGFNSPDGGYQPVWTFEADRLTGKGMLAKENAPSVTYQCKPTKQQF